MLKQELELLEIQRDRLLHRVRELLENLPDNPKKTHLRDKCYLLKSSDLVNSRLDPFYYDFKRQYERILTKLESLGTNFASMQLYLRNITKDLVVESWDCRQKVKFHPEVIKNIRRIL